MDLFVAKVEISDRRLYIVSFYTIILSLIWGKDASFI